MKSEKIKLNIAVYLGESFYEAALAFDPNVKKRYFHRSLWAWDKTKNTFSLWLDEILKQEGIKKEEVNIRSILALGPLPSKAMLEMVDDDKIAFVCTQGFTSWPKLREPLSPAYVSLSAQRSFKTPSEKWVFPVDERTTVQGEVLKPVQESELASLAEKLKELGVTKLALGFLHAEKNPSNQKKAEAYFLSKGFKVFTAEKGGPTRPDEVLNWQTAYAKAWLKAYYSQALEDFLQGFKNQIQLECEVHLAAQPDLLEILTENSFVPLPLPSLFYSSPEKAKSRELVCYFGYESFFTIEPNESKKNPHRSAWGKLNSFNEGLNYLKVQPTCLIEDFLNHGDWDTQNRQSLSPLFFGKSLKPMLLDVLLFPLEKTPYNNHLVNKELLNKKYLEQLKSYLLQKKLKGEAMAKSTAAGLKTRVGNGLNKRKGLMDSEQLWRAPGHEADWAQVLFRQLFSLLALEINARGLNHDQLVFAGPLADFVLGEMKRELLKPAILMPEYGFAKCEFVLNEFFKKS